MVWPQNVRQSTSGASSHRPASRQQLHSTSISTAQGTHSWVNPTCCPAVAKAYRRRGHLPRGRKHWPGWGSLPSAAGQEAQQGMEVPCDCSALQWALQPQLDCSPDHGPEGVLVAGPHEAATHSRYAPTTAAGINKDNQFNYLVLGEVAHILGGAARPQLARGYPPPRGQHAARRQHCNKAGERAGVRAEGRRAAH